jgi:GDP-D-mannose 3',5'-epimerase
MGSKVVVTGGAGFIGSNLVRKLLDHNRNVVIADDFSRGSLQNLSDLGIRISDVSQGDSDMFVDLTDYTQALKVIQDAEIVFHLAARIGSIDYLHGSSRNEVEALQSNIVIDSNVFKACLASGVSRIVYASSAAVYPINLQNNLDVVLSENAFEVLQDQDGHVDTRHATVNPDGGYGWAKLLGEIQVQWMQNINAGIARIFNVYGENQDLVKAVQVVPSLFLKASRYPDDDFVVWGDGRQTRDFLYVKDCVDALLELERRASSPPVLVNIGSGQHTSIATIAEMVVALSKKDIRISYDSSKPVGPLSRTADTVKVEELLDWQPNTSLEEGLKETYSWLQKRLRKV